MPWIGLSRRNLLAPPQIPLPHQRRLAREGLRRREIFRPKLPPEPARAAKHRHTALRRHTSARQHHDPLRRANPGDDAIHDATSTPHGTLRSGSERRTSHALRTPHWTSHPHFALDFALRTPHWTSHSALRTGLRTRHSAPTPHSALRTFALSTPDVLYSPRAPPAVVALLMLFFVTLIACAEPPSKEMNQAQGAIAGR